MSKMTDEQRHELQRLAELPDEDIDTSDIPEVADFSRAVRGRFYRPVKRQITLRIDADLLEWFRAQGGKYQTRINAALREYVEEHHGRARKSKDLISI
ncbi:MAG: BrnA antitoxin family protein [Pseudomonadota bacterium]|nr:BrnA antitoxin family protein [Pseudomonadota bacterium]